jgi:glycosyltransferase involved in cell wall biosynthesis
MLKPLCVISCPIDTYSGYAAKSRSIAKAIIELKKDEWDIKIIPQMWGNTPWNYIKDHYEQWGFLEPYLLHNPQLPKQPEIFIMVSVPNEMQSIGKFNILFTSAMETTLSDHSWISGANKADLIIVPSEHAKKSLVDSIYEQKDNNGRLIGKLQIEKPISKLIEEVDTEVYKHITPDQIVDLKLDEIKNKWNYLFVGHWLHGDLGHDRKNVGLLIKAFLELFKNKQNAPGLILKTSGAGASYFDREIILSKIDEIKKTVKANILPDIYLIHGELSDTQMNELYNNPKVKAMISLTKGECWGRPLLEFSVTKKPIIASNWSGHLDFLHPEFTNLINGGLENVHPSAVVPNMILAESKWFNPDLREVGFYMKDIFENYKNYLDKAKRQSHYSKTNFSYNNMKTQLDEIFKSKIPEFAKPVELKLPQLKKIELPKLSKIN